MFSFVKKLFRGKKTTFSDVQTAPLSEEQLKAVSITPVALRPLQLLVGSAQSIGKQRDHNEDSLFTLNAILADGTSELPFGIFLIADGMGGHQHGEIASGVAVRAFSHYMLSRLYLPFINLISESPGESIQELMETAVHEAQQAVVRRAPGGGTTLTAALVLGEQVTIAHVGDSRAYFVYPDGRMQVITHDHSLVHRLVELGQLNEDEALSHPQRNVLYRAVGQSEPYRPDIDTYQLPHPGSLLICSDGLWSVVAENQVFRIIKNAANPSIACHELVKAANDAGGPDNISVVLVQFLA
ncbi:MAG TPA: protein phosphatase 2C domain-containing protein [Longilinea sp.]|nr:protein phosphatase 2C domain-containing protein [Longilinea sp.]